MSEPTMCACCEQECDTETACYDPLTEQYVCEECRDEYADLD